MDDYDGRETRMNVNEVVTDDFSANLGGWQGGTRIPEEFNGVMQAILGAEIGKWQKEGKGLMVDGILMNHTIWADNVIIPAEPTE